MAVKFDVKSKKNKTESTELASLIRDTRKWAGLSQSKLAEAAGVGKTLIFDLEKGHETVSYENLKKVLHILNIKIQLQSPLKSKNDSAIYTQNLNRVKNKMEKTK